MRVFISWSGSPSREVAEAFKVLLEDVIHSCDVRLSHNFPYGDRWRARLDSELDAVEFGIGIITPHNLSSHWINYEAGAIAKSVDDGRFVPVRCGVEEAHMIRGPLAGFQSIPLKKAEIQNLFSQVDSCTGENSIGDIRIRRGFERFYPDFKDVIEKIEYESSEGAVSEEIRAIFELRKVVLGLRFDFNKILKEIIDNDSILRRFEREVFEEQKTMEKKSEYSSAINEQRDLND